jgi:hypothetical protein
MNDYITLDGKRYKARFPDFDRLRRKPSRERMTLGGDVDVTYGPAVWILWEGSLIVEVSPGDSVNYGSCDELDATFDKTEAVGYTDHFGTVYTAHVVGVLQRQSLTPVHDGATNRFVYRVRIIRATTV